LEHDFCSQKQFTRLIVSPTSEYQITQKPEIENEKGVMTKKIVINN
jgi:hypothetical protein